MPRLRFGVVSGMLRIRAEVALSNDGRYGKGTCPFLECGMANTAEFLRIQLP